MRSKVTMSIVWDRTAEFLSDNFAQILPVALLAFFLPASIEGSVSAAVAGSGMSVQLAAALVQLLFAVLSLWGTLALTVMALDLLSDASAPQIAGRRLPAMLLLSMVLIGAMVVLLLPMPIALVLSGIQLQTLSATTLSAVPAGTAAFIALYLLALVILGVWVGARLMLVTPVLVREHRLFAAIPRSWQLTRGMGFRLLGVLILYAVVSWVAVLAANLVFGSIFALIARDGDGNGVGLSDVLTSIVNGVVQSGFMVILPVFAAKLYLEIVATQSSSTRAAA